MTRPRPHLLIPRGARLIGRYDSQVAFGQRCVLLVWIRLILPDTWSVALDRLPGIGSPVRVMVNKDLILRSYQPLFFKPGSSQ
ncbi:TrbI/VirB10 family protein [Variovorax paradoxus]|uniref:TrbI/VirB10 family protein n=1 Tax=Variovorax paradoxus TaxID=34073 RepID=UPI003F4F687D